MNRTENLYCLILAGGKGRRLWPESTVDYPKQFIDFFGTGRTQIQQTYDRFHSFMPTDHILISTSVKYVNLVKQQLPDIPESNILVEPIWRNTAPSVAWGAVRVLGLNPDATLVVAPSDQVIINSGKFEDSVTRASEFVAKNEALLTMGVIPTRPEPGYGYIQKNERAAEDLYYVRSFTEKPNREFAQVFMDSGEFLWNTGIFVFGVSYLIDCFKELLPTVLEGLDSTTMSADELDKHMTDNFPICPNVTMEQGILEKAPCTTVMQCDFGWADFGTWHGIYEVEHKMDGDNIVLDSDVILDESHGNIIKVPKGHLAVINGLNNYIVVEKNNTLLICPREDSSALIRKYSAEVEMR